MGFYRRRSLVSSQKHIRFWWLATQQLLEEIPCSSDAGDVWFHPLQRVVRIAEASTMTNRPRVRAFALGKAPLAP
jgi:hypothetical protein